MALRFRTRYRTFATVLIAVVLGLRGAHAKELRITIPRFTELTPVQRLNREGVEAARKHQIDKAQELFYKAYLFDPGDPFTLNNLGYAAELQGDADRALKFYALAEKQDCNAEIDLSSLNQLKGKPMLYALQDLQDASLRLNRINVQAIELLRNHEGFEAEILLRRALVLDPKNPFTLNNLAVAEESVGDLVGAAEHYQAAVDLHSPQTVIVSPELSWRGKDISVMAASSLHRVEERLTREGADQARATMLSLRGVQEVNENQWPAARRDFLAAYSLDPTSAFSLNNRGYVAEKEGDLETAEFFYAKARRAQDGGDRVGMATQASAQGERLSVVASGSSRQVQAKLEQYSESQRNQPGAPELVPRGAGAATQPPTQPNNAAPPASSPQTPSQAPSQPRPPQTHS